MQDSKRNFRKEDIQRHNQDINVYLSFITIKKIKIKNHYDTIPYTTRAIKPKSKIIPCFDENLVQPECSDSTADNIT